MSVKGSESTRIKNKVCQTTSTNDLHFAHILKTCQFSCMQHNVIQSCNNPDTKQNLPWNIAKI